MAATGSPSGELYLSALRKRAVVDAGGQTLGKVDDVIVRLAGRDHPPVTGLVIDLAGRKVFMHPAGVTDWSAERIHLASPKVDLRAFERRDGEVLVHADILGHRLVDVEAARLVRAYDAQLTPTAGGGWQLWALDVHQVGRLHWPGRHPAPHWRDWTALQPLIGHRPSRRARAGFGLLGRLRPAELADLIEAARRDEQDELLEGVHADPELEADVFEELDDENARRLLEARPDAQVAQILARMRADDAADALAGLPQDRRAGVLDALPEAQRTKVRTLLGYNTATAGGLMGVDYLALPADTSVRDALMAVRTAAGLQPEALVCIYSLDTTGRLAGAANLVRLLQADAAATLASVAEPDPVAVRAEADVVEVTTLMADYNLLTLPVLGDRDQIVGVITVDDVLESILPVNWRHREPAVRVAHPARTPTPPSGG